MGLCQRVRKSLYLWHFTNLLRHGVGVPGMLTTGRSCLPKLRKISRCLHYTAAPNNERCLHMGTKLTAIKAIRVGNEVKEWLDGIDSRRMVESVYTLVGEGSLSVGEDGKVEVYTPKKDVKVVEKVVERVVEVPCEAVERREIDVMAESVGLCRDDLLNDLEGKLERGEIGLTREGLSVGDACPFEWKGFTEACDEMGYGYDETLRKLIPMVYKG